MTIVYVIEKMSGIGGMERIFADKINWLCKRSGIELTLLLVWKDAHPIEYPIDERVNIVKLEVPYVKGGLFYPLALYRYNQFIKKTKPDITVLSWVMGAFLGAYGHHVGKIIYESHLAATMMKHRWLINKMQYHVDTVVTLTTHDTTNFIKAPRVLVIPNFTLLDPAVTPSYESRHCVALGRFVYQKDYPRMIAIWKKVTESHPDWILDIFGDGEDRPIIEQCIKEAQLGNKVVLHGNTQEVTKAYTSGSIYLMTSRMEGFPLVLIEAMTCGLPIVAFNCPYGPQHVVQHEITGYLIPYDNDDAYIKALSALMNNVHLRKQMGNAAKTVVSKYACETIMQKWMNLFQELSQ